MLLANWNEVFLSHEQSRIIVPVIPLANVLLVLKNLVHKLMQMLRGNMYIKVVVISVSDVQRIYDSSR